MRKMLLAGAAVLLTAGPALAQSAYQAGGCYHNGIPDCGPTPGSDSAFAGGGIVMVNPNGTAPPRLTEPLPPLPPPAAPPGRPYSPYE